MNGPLLSVVVPAFNEQALLASTVRQMRESLRKTEVEAEIIIVNDGSRDQTAEQADALAAESGGMIRALHQPNQGIGGAFRTGARAARGDYVMLWPADMPATPETLAPYVQNLGRADVIVGCRDQRVGYNPLMRFNAWLYPKLVSRLFGLQLRDVNWIHAYRRDAFLRLQLTERGIPMMAETLVRLRDAGESFREIDVEMVARPGRGSASRVKVMWRTLTGLLRFWRTWCSEKKDDGHKEA